MGTPMQGRAWPIGGSLWVLRGRGRDIRWALVEISGLVVMFRGVTLLPGGLHCEEKVVVVALSEMRPRPSRCPTKNERTERTEINEATNSALPTQHIVEVQHHLALRTEVFTLILHIFRGRKLS